MNTLVEATHKLSLRGSYRKAPSNTTTDSCLTFLTQVLPRTARRVVHSHPASRSVVIRHTNRHRGLYILRTVGNLRLYGNLEVDTKIRIRPTDSDNTDQSPAVVSLSEERIYLPHSGITRIDAHPGQPCGMDVYALLTTESVGGVAPSPHQAWTETLETLRIGLVSHTGMMAAVEQLLNAPSWPRPVFDETFTDEIVGWRVDGDTNTDDSDIYLTCAGEDGFDHVDGDEYLTCAGEDGYGEDTDSTRSAFAFLDELLCIAALNNMSWGEVVDDISVVVDNAPGSPAATYAEDYT